jgi:hypothetical protein
MRIIIAATPRQASGVQRSGGTTYRETLRSDAGVNIFPSLYFASCSEVMRACDRKFQGEDAEAVRFLVRTLRMIIASIFAATLCFATLQAEIGHIAMRGGEFARSRSIAVQRKEPMRE